MDQLTTAPVSQKFELKQPESRPLVSIVAPVYNEATVLNDFLSRLQTTVAKLSGVYDFEFIFVDDGSRDQSLSILKSLIKKETRVRVLELRKNYGQTAALQAGLDAAKGEIMISMDADLQHFPEEIPEFLEKITQGADVVCGWRHERQEGVIRRWPSRMANYLLRKISGLSIHDIGTTFRAYRRSIVQDIRLFGENHRFVPIFAKLVGANIVEIPIKNIERPTGKSNYGLSRTFNVFLDLFFLYFQTRYLDRPIRLFGKIALFLAMGSLAIAAWLIGLSLLTGVGAVREHSGWFMLSAFMMLTAVQLILTGVLAEVMTRIYFQSGKQTAYHVRAEWHSEAVN